MDGGRRGCNRDVRRSASGAVDVEARTDRAAWICLSMVRWNMIVAIKEGEKCRGQ